VRILMHCNGGPGIGVGHVVRSVALAEEAIAGGHRVAFAGEFEGDFVLRQLDLLGLEVHPVVRGDEHALVKAVEAFAPDVLHLDTYEEPGMSALAVDPATLVSNVEDDGFGRRRADVVVDPNFGAERERAGILPKRAYLRGSRYAPLRATVTSRRGEWQLREEATRVLVVMGGADPMNLTPAALDVLAATGLPLHVTAVTPRAVQGADALGSGMTVEVLPPVEDLPALLTQQDLVMSAAGTSVWELCCLGVPMALVCAVDNQRPGYDRVVAAGAAIGLGSRLRGQEASDAAGQLKQVLGNAATRQSLARQARHIVDGLGAWRVVRAWEQLAHRRLTMRRASMADAETLLRWRSDPVTRRHSRDHAEISLDQHRDWLQSSVERDDRILLIASDADGDVGTVRWDLVGDGEWEVSITVAPERRGEGWARRLLDDGERTLVHPREDVYALVAGVHQDNAASLRLFQRAGYLPDMPADEAGFLTFRKLVVR
jgi:spore coat polysaccharide biosynthesis predicted glycosyltransferase SpsG/RimJ/RimL family protein N-acetyltransferase